MARLIVAILTTLISLSVSAHPGHGKSFGTAEEPNALGWGWATLIIIVALIGVWRLYANLKGSKSHDKPDAH